MRYLITSLGNSSSSRETPSSAPATPFAIVTVTLPPPARIHDTHWVALPLTAAEQAAKKAALHEYTSQLAFMPDLLGRFLRPNELFGRVDPSVLARIAASH